MDSGLRNFVNMKRSILQAEIMYTLAYTGLACIPLADISKFGYQYGLLLQMHPKEQEYR